MNRLQQSRRQKIGYTYQPQINNNVANVPYLRNPYHVQHLAFEQNQMGMGGYMEGEGFRDILKGIYNKGKRVGKFLYGNKGAIADIYSGPIGTALRNAIPDSDDTARPGFPGEKHAILKLPNGKYGVGNYIGPGTHLVERLKRGDPPRTEVDKVAQAHDIRYFQAKNINDVRKADNIMLNKVNAIARNRGDAPQNIAQAKLIKAKVIGENLGLLKRDAFSGNFKDNAKIALDNKTMFDNKLKQLSQAGYGLNPPGKGMLPGDALKMKLLRQMKKKKGSGVKSNKGVSMSKTYPGMKGYKMNQGKLSGAGLGLPGKGAITDFVTKKIIPSIMSTVGIPSNTIPIGTITTIISKALNMAKNGNLSSIIGNLAKTILPLITHAKIKTMGGSGRLMKGQGITNLLGKSKDMLLTTLGKGIYGAFKWFLNKSAKSEGYKLPFSGSGLNVPGGSFANFWKDFKKGFTMVFKPGAKILSTVATALGQPELGVPLGILGNMM